MHAANSYWSASGTNTDQGGTGTWDTTSPFWDSAATGGTMSAWNNAGTTAAVFGGSAGTVTIAANTTINVNGLTFTSTTAGGYVINGTDSTSILNLMGPTVTITGTSAAPATINAILSGSSNITKSDNSLLTLGGDNLLSGTMTISLSSSAFAGVTVTNAQAVNGTTHNGLGSMAVSVTNGGRLTLRNDGTGGTGAGTINYGNNITLGNAPSGGLVVTPYTSGGTVANKTVALGTLTLNTGGSTTSANISGSNGYGVSFGNVTLASSSGVAIQTNTTFGAISENTSGLILTKFGAGTLTLTGAGSYSGGTKIVRGTVSVAAMNYLGSGTISLGGSDTPSGGGQQTGILNYTGSGETSTLAINLNGTTGGGTIDTTGATGGLILSPTSFTAFGSGSKTFTLTGDSAGNQFNGAIIDNLPGTNLTALTKAGSGSWLLSGANTYTGNTSLSGGTVTLDYSTNNNSKIAGVLTLAGVNLNLNGGSTAQGVTSTTLSAGASSIGQSGGSSTIALGAITRSTAGTLNLGAGSIATTTTVNSAAGILGGWATVGGTDWAVSGTSGTNPITALSSYSTLATAAGTDTLNSLVTGSMTLAAGAHTTNTLKLTTTAAGQSLGIGSGNTLTLTAGGLLFTGSNDYSITSGTLKSNTATNSELIVNQHGAGVLTIGSVIANGTGASILTKTGAGTLALTGANTYTGQTYVQQGVLSINSNAALGAVATGAQININGGTLQLTAGSGAITLDNSGANKRNIALGINGGTIGVLGTDNLTVSGVVSGAAGTGGLTKTGSGTLTLSGSNTYTGKTKVTAGTMLIGTTGNINTTSGVAINGGTFNYTNNTTALSRNVTVAGGNFKYNSTAAYGGVLTFSSGTVSGSGNLSTTALSIGSGQTLSPGNSPGTLSTGAETWANGGTYIWEINALATSAIPGTEGSDPGWDFANISGPLTITAGVGQFNLNVDSLVALDNWNTSGTYQWRIATASGGVTGFDPNAFNIDTSAFSDQNSIAGGAFSVSNIGNDVFLNYTPVPEPSTFAMIGLGLGALCVLRRRHKSSPELSR